MIPEDKVELLKMVSEPLRVELHLEMYSPLVSSHPFLRRYSENHPEVMGKVCREGVSTQWLSRGDVIFSQGQIPEKPKMLFACEASLEYEMDGKKEELTKGQWASEATLWTNWMHRGTLRAISESTVLQLEADTFADIVSQFWTPQVNPKKYAREFVARLNDMDPSSLSDLTKVVREDEDVRGSTISQQRLWASGWGSLFGVYPSGSQTMMLETVRN